MSLLTHRPNAPKGKRMRRGMSLVEVMVAMTMLAVVLSSLAYLAGQASIRSRKAATGTYRSALANELASRFSSMPYDSVPIYLRTDTIAAGGTSYIRRIALSDVPNSTVTKKVSITVIPRSSPSDSVVAFVYRARPSLENVLNTP